jgi:ParB-like chromosome segregation protein Spo0J
MLLSQITVDAQRYQLRDTPWSEQTVSGILAGFNPSKFDALPILLSSPGHYIVAGDGHSRYEAVRRLAERAELPARWAITDAGGKPIDWDIPSRTVTHGEARKLSFTANLSRDNLTAVEESKVFQRMLDIGYSIDQIASESHRKVDYIKSSLPLNCLCVEIRAAVGQTSDAGGIPVDAAKALAAKFQQYKWTATAQQSLYHKLLVKTYLNPQMARELIDGLQARSGGKSADDLLFALPENVGAVLTQMKGDMENMKRASRALNGLIQAAESGVLSPFAELDALVRQQGKRIMGLMDQVVNGCGAQLVLDTISGK